MTRVELNRLLGGWEGYALGAVGRLKTDSGEEEVLLELLARTDRVKRCSGCGQEVAEVHDYEERLVQDLPLLGTPTWLRVFRCRVKCPRCGPKLEQLEWLAPYRRVTRRLAESVARLCRVLPIQHVAEFFGLHWSTVKAIDKAHLQESLGPVDLSGVEVIAMDEFAIQKGHRYATVIVEPHSKRVLWVGRGRSREDIRPFFEQLGAEGRRRLKAVVMDMSAAYEEEVRYQCPLVEIVYDLFHVVAKYGREVIDRVRVDEANRLRHDKPARKVIKGARWLLLRNRENVRREDRVKLRELLSANRRLFTIYVLKDDLKRLWQYSYAGAARRFWKQWYHRAIASRIEALKRFARNLRQRLDGILAHCRWPLHTSLLEGIFLMGCPSLHARYERALRSLLWRLRPVQLQRRVELLLGVAGRLTARGRFSEAEALAAVYLRRRRRAIDRLAQLRTAGGTPRSGVAPGAAGSDASPASRSAVGLAVPRPPGAAVSAGGDRRLARFRAVAEAVLPAAPPPDGPDFHCDAALGGLARWLRAYGYDARWWPDIDDDELLARTRGTTAILLTTDRRLAARGALRHGVFAGLLVPVALRKRQQLAHVIAHLDLPRKATRCMACGGELRRVEKDRVRDRIPPRTFPWRDDYWLCAWCDRLFWEGTHRERIETALREARMGEAAG